MRLMNANFIFGALLTLGTLTACKKDKPDAAPQPSNPVSEADKMKDSTLLYTRDLYLWYRQIPTTFDARKFADPNAIMQGIRPYSNEPGFSNPVDLWSFAMKKSEWDKVASGVSGDFGLNVFFNAPGDLRVRFVEKQSPAGKAGIRRGWRITKINNSTNITTDNSDFIVQNVYNSPSSSFTFEKPDGSSANITLNRATYQENPIFLDTVYTASSKKIGYMVFNSFLGDTSAVYQDFDRIFRSFSQANVTDVVIDLRYNGGGYVSMQEKLANYLINNSGNKQLMMEQMFNDKLASFNRSTYFNKLGSLNLNRIFFIVSRNSASASELLINNLKPFMEVKLVGPSKTYGKAVGYFPYPVNDWYIFPVSFRTVNKNKQGNYFGGMELDKQVADGIDKDWGDSQEASLASVLKYITTGSFRVMETAPYRELPAVVKANEALDQNTFKGAIDVRKLRP